MEMEHFECAAKKSWTRHTVCGRQTKILGTHLVLLAIPGTIPEDLTIVLEKIQNYFTFLTNLAQKS